MKNTLGVISTCFGAAFLVALPASAQEDIQAVANPAISESTTPERVEKETEKPKQEATNAPLRDPNKVICKKSEKTSTRLRRKKICKTRAKWDEERVATGKAIRDIRSQTRVDQYD